MTVERTVLRDGYSISRVIKGGWQLAGGHGAYDRTEAIQAMAAFVDSGISTFDCADIYTGVEAMIGEFLTNLRKEQGTQATDRIQIHTKLVPDFDRLESIGPADIEKIIDRSLARLCVDRLDLVQFYWWDMSRGSPIAVLSSLKRLQEKGKIRHLGANNWDRDNIRPFLEAGLDLATMQVQYSLLDSRPQGDFSDWCSAHGISILCYGTIAGGFLTERWLGEADPGYAFENRSLVKYRLIIDEFGGWDLFQNLLEVLQRIASKHGVSLAAVASRTILDRPNVAAVIIGARTARNLPKTLSIFQFELDDSDRSDIAEVLVHRTGPTGLVYALEGDKSGPHGRIMKYNLNTGDE